jgi:NTE family protein
MARPPPTLAVALQGGGSHGAFTWGVLDRLLQEVATDRLRISAISGSSAGAINGALTVSGLVQGGPGLARRKLADFWHALSRRGLFAGNPLFYGEPGSFGINLDWSPIAIALEAIGLVVSPYMNPFYSDALAPLIAEAIPAADLTAINVASEPQLFVAATNVVSNTRAIFTQPDITAEGVSSEWGVKADSAVRLVRNTRVFPVLASRKRTRRRCKG